MFKSLFASLLCVLAFYTAALAQTHTLTWKAKNVSITVPDDYKVTVNNETEFKAQGNTPDRWIHMFQVDYSLKIDIEPDAFDYAMGLGYAGDKYGMGSVKKSYPLDIDNLIGLCKDSFKDGKKALFTGFQDKKTKEEFIVVLAFEYTSKTVWNEFFEYIKTVTK